MICAHVLCADCAGEMERVYALGGGIIPRCPICRVNFTPQPAVEDALIAYNGRGREAAVAAAEEFLRLLQEADLAGPVPVPETGGPQILIPLLAAGNHLLTNYEQRRIVIIEDNWMYYDVPRWYVMGFEATSNFFEVLPYIGFPCRENIRMKLPRVVVNQTLSRFHFLNDYTKENFALVVTYVRSLIASVSMTDIQERTVTYGVPLYVWYEAQARRNTLMTVHETTRDYVITRARPLCLHLVRGVALFSVLGWFLTRRK